MVIAQVAPLYESVPPEMYGGTERIISYLTEELVKLGHQVTLYASGDSMTKAHLRAVCPHSLRLDKLSIDPVADHIYLTEIIFNEAYKYDFIHSHIDYIAYPLLKRIKTPHVTTLHGRLDIPNLYNVYRAFPEMPIISISDYQRYPISWANWQGTVYHGLPEELYTFREEPGEYLVFIGRISPEKRVDYAIEIARQAGMPIKIAAKVSTADKEYFDTEIKHLLSGSHIEYLGEIGEQEKNELLNHAYALIFPIGWPEPFGLVMLEALACGTPIIAYRNGSVPEVLEQGVTGYIVNNMEEAVAAVKKIPEISRKRCREVFEKRFTARKMTEAYLEIYKRLLAGHE
jgi:glycosyltransferase involved in cell wall biosynthesis